MGQLLLVVCLVLAMASIVDAEHGVHCAAEGDDRWLVSLDERPMLRFTVPAVRGAKAPSVRCTPITNGTDEWFSCELVWNIAARTLQLDGQVTLARDGSAPIKGKVTPSYRYNADQTWEDILSRGASHTAMADGPGGVEETLRTQGDILEKAEKKLPLCFKWDAGEDLVLVFLTWPFADSPEWNVRVRITPGQERDVRMHRQWPMLRVFSKSDPQYGLE